jgi:hypothetical protein
VGGARHFSGSPMPVGCWAGGQNGLQELPPCRKRAGRRAALAHAAGLCNAIAENGKVGEMGAYLPSPNPHFSELRYKALLRSSPFCNRLPIPSFRGVTPICRASQVAGALRTEHHDLSTRDRTIARIAARTPSGRRGQASINRTRSGSEGAKPAEPAPDFAAPAAAGFPKLLAQQALGKSCSDPSVPNLCPCKESHPVARCRTNLRASPPSADPCELVQDGAADSRTGPRSASAPHRVQASLAAELALSG